MNEAETVDVQLNVLAEKAPNVPAAFADSDTVFLANTHPTLQRDLLAQLDRPRLTVCDSMNLWIQNERDSLLETLRLVTGVIINDGEARQLTDRVNLIEAGEFVLGLGPRFVIIKKGEHGAVVFAGGETFSAPAYLLEDVVDPTGAGDSFAGGMVAALARADDISDDSLRFAAAVGTVTASFCVEEMGPARLAALDAAGLRERLALYRRMVYVPDMEL